LKNEDQSEKQVVPETPKDKVSLIGIFYAIISAFSFCIVGLSIKTIY
jgi:hypothetical protein